jgi:hypothetical protein
VWIVRLALRRPYTFVVAAFLIGDSVQRLERAHPATGPRRHGLSEQRLYHLGANFIRTQLATVQGASVLQPLGGRPRQVMVDLDPQALFARGISPADVSAAINAQNLILPAGEVKIGDRAYPVGLNGTPDAVDAVNDLPIRRVPPGEVRYRQRHSGGRNGMARGPGRLTAGRSMHTRIPHTTRRIST